VVMIVWWFDLQLPMQSVPNTTNVVSLNHVHGEVYSIQYYVIKFPVYTPVSSTNKTDCHDIARLDIIWCIELCFPVVGLSTRKQHPDDLILQNSV
jgi:hypothetical protein